MIRYYLDGYFHTECTADCVQTFLSLVNDDELHQLTIIISIWYYHTFNGLGHCRLMW